MTGKPDREPFVLGQGPVQTFRLTQVRDQAWKNFENLLHLLMPLMVAHRESWANGALACQSGGLNCNMPYRRIITAGLRHQGLAMPSSPDGVHRTHQAGRARQRRCRAPGRAAPARAGIPRAAGNRQKSRRTSRNQASAAYTQEAGAGARPRWKQPARELWFGGVLVKRFRVPARNQTLILAAFEEDGWPDRIDDPLPPVAGTNGKRRLHNAINCLNRAHRARVMRFFGDGTGTGICWKQAQPDCNHTVTSAPLEWARKRPVE